MIYKIRPRQIFQHLAGLNNEVRLVIPTIPGTESLTIFALETELLIAAARIVKAKSIMEIGTSRGYTALHLARNTGARVLTIDIANKPCVFESLPEARRIFRYIGTVEDYRFDSEELHVKLEHDMIFIDADHRYDAVKLDTEAAFKFDPKVVAWHDFGNPSEPDVEHYLRHLGQTKDLYHVEDSWIVFWFKEELEF